MTGRAALARVNARLDEIDGGPVLAGIAAFLALFIAGLVFGNDRVIDVILAVGFVGTAWYATTVAARTDKASDDADIARGGMEAIQDHLSGVGTGRHAGKP